VQSESSATIDILQGRVKSPTGGESPRIRQLADRSGEIPGPTVKVWMEEEFLMGPFAFGICHHGFIIPALKS
jgi:hypothetical protein